MKIPRPDDKDVSDHIVGVLQTFGEATLDQIARAVPFMDEHVAPVIATLAAQGVVTIDGEVARASIPPDDRRVAIARLARAIFSPDLTPALDARLASSLYDELRRRAVGRPTEDIEFRQRHVTLRTALLRALYLCYRRDLYGKRIVLLGDDDLTSLALALVGGYESLHVLEVDHRLVSFLEDRLGDAATIVAWDARDDVPSKLLGAADTFLCDPSRRLYDLFLRRGTELTAPDGVLYLFANPSHSPPLEFSPLLTRILGSGLLLTDVVPFFNDYARNPEVMGSYGAFAASASGEGISFTESLIRAAKGNPEELARRPR
jgi:hypothetical protein